MLGNLAEALLTLVMVLIVPGLLLVGVLLRDCSQDRRRGKSERGGPGFGEPGDGHRRGRPEHRRRAAQPSSRSRRTSSGASWRAAAGRPLFRRARRHRWFALGGYLLGMGSRRRRHPECRADQSRSRGDLRPVHRPHLLGQRCCRAQWSGDAAHRNHRGACLA